MDSALWEMCRAAGIDCRQQTAVYRLEHHGPFRITTGAEEISAELAINASGRWSNLNLQSDDLRSQYNGNGSGPKLLGLKAHFRETDAAQSVDLYIFRNGYCGVQPAGPDLINACAMVRADEATNLQQVFAMHPTLAVRSRKWYPVGDPARTAPLCFHPPAPWRGGVFCAGDAAGFIDPFAGDGITLALLSGRLAAESAALYLNGRASREAAGRLYGQRFRQELEPVFHRAARLRKLLALPRPLQSAVARALQLQPLADFLVEHTRPRA